MRPRKIDTLSATVIAFLIFHLTISAEMTGVVPPAMIKIQNAPNNLSVSSRTTDNILDWFNKNPEIDGIEGVSADRVYSEFNLYKKRLPTVVAVIDSGVDIHHEDLKGKIWVNNREIPNNGIDDDRNGYVDDMHGWNFIGGKDGRNVEFDTLEVTRELIRYQKEIRSGKLLTPEEHQYFDTVKAEYETGLSHAQDIYKFSLHYHNETLRYKKILKDKMGIKKFHREALNQLNSDLSIINEARDFLIESLDTFGSFDRIGKFLTYYSNQINYHYNIRYDSRSDIVKDNPNQLHERGYGNNNVKDSFSDHGTHVAGIIAANRFNKIGIKGIASNVKIMVLRAVPNGDERDKDIANAVFYAVNNGARIINMSFGKRYSPQKAIVDEAFKYANRKGVLIVHAAGNDSSNIDEIKHYPNRYLNKSPLKIVNTWIEVGASSFQRNSNMVAYFSNFGKESVDIFAPGYQTTSTTPGNQYSSYSGTSMASPVLSGVAALILSQSPSLDGEKLKSILLTTARSYPNLKVTSPESPDQLVPFSDLSISGGVVDAYFAFKKLSERQSEKSSSRELK